MNTVLAIVLISLFIIAPLTMVFAIACDSNIAKAAAIILTVVIHVAFWVTFKDDLESYEVVFTFAGLYETVPLAGAYYIICEIID